MSVKFQESVASIWPLLNTFSVIEQSDKEPLIFDVGFVPPSLGEERIQLLKPSRRDFCIDFEEPVDRHIEGEVDKHLKHPSFSQALHRSPLKVSAKWIKESDPPGVWPE